MGVCVDGVESMDSLEDVNWWPLLRGKVLAMGDDICGILSGNFPPDWCIAL